ncbi:MAG: glycosyl hydrolase [Phycisphaerae bacterium]|nr:glycosyl hydrolase [Phycisphaerae bacterium]
MPRSLLSLLGIVLAAGPALAQPETGKDRAPAGTDPAPPQSAEAAKEPAKSSIKPEVFGGLSARGIGPALLSGRIADIAVNPKNMSEWYVAAASGNLWKTTNAGVTFSPIFDSYGSYSIGCVTIDPTNPSVVWAGSGENNSQRSVSWGDGVYVSRDGGKSFSNLGLKDSGHIGMIRVHPDDSATVFVAAMGPLWSDGGDRGLYRSTDGGKSWERVLFVSDRTGISEVHIDPRNASVMYATAYQRRRHVWTLVNGGPESSIYKSEDGGATWRKVETGLPGGDRGRIGLCISPANPDIVYAIVEGIEGSGGVYRSRDRGETWEKRSGYMTTSPQYYNELFADPINPDKFYAVDTFMSVSEDGGATMKRVPIQDVHVDSHALWIDPTDTRHMLLGNDGGLYETHDGAHWRHFENLPLMQFYRVGIDNSWPFYSVYGGTQDNSTIGGPSRTTDRVGVTNEDWYVTVGGDGFEVVIDPEDPNIVYCESQDGGLTRFDRRSGEGTDIRPREKPGEQPYVFNWDTPLLISPHRKERLYYAGNFLFRSDDRGESWTRISGDLTRGLDRNQLKVFGVIQKPEAPSKHLSTSIFGNSVSLTESPLAEGLIYVGTDDGLIHVTSDASTSWRRIENFPTIPEWAYVSDLEASRHGRDTVYATFENHKMGDSRPYVLRSEDRGTTWKSIVGNLPDRGPVYTIAEDHVNPSLLFCGTEFGAYFTIDGGTTWTKIGGLPTIEVRDLEIQRRDDDLVMATFGRGFYILHDYSPMRASDSAIFEKPAAVFPPRTALAYLQRSRLGNSSGRGWAGAAYWNAPNPAYGATFTIHLKDGLKTLKEKRLDAQKKDGWAYPTLDEFRTEDNESTPRVMLTIRDAAGAVVRRLEGPKSAGLHRVNWDLRLADSDPVTLGGGGARDPWDNDRGGIMATPGTYTVQVSRIENGASTDLCDPVPFVVQELEQSTFAARGQSRTEKFEFEMRVSELNRAVSGMSRVLGEQENRLSHLLVAIKDTPELGPAEIQEHEALRRRISTIKTDMFGDPTLAKRAVAAPPSIVERVSVALDSRTATHPPTGTQRQQYEFAVAEFSRAQDQIRALESSIRALEEKVERSGGPWTPGRIPVLRGK